MFNELIAYMHSIARKLFLARPVPVARGVSLVKGLMVLLFNSLSLSSLDCVSSSCEEQFFCKSDILHSDILAVLRVLCTPHHQ